jgi:hypothetical protein
MSMVKPKRKAAATPDATATAESPKKESEANKWRLRFWLVSPDEIKTLFCWEKYDVVRIPMLPTELNSAEVLEVQYLQDCRMFGVLLRHESFHELTEGTRIPCLDHDPHFVWTTCKLDPKGDGLPSKALRSTADIAKPKFETVNCLDRIKEIIRDTGPQSCHALAEAIGVKIEIIHAAIGDPLYPGLAFESGALKLSDSK